MSNNKIRIVHFSDIHFDENELIDFNYFVKTPLINDLKKINSENIISLIFITGDLINKGGKDFKNPQTSFTLFYDSFIESLINELGIQKNRIFFTIGNHDVLRSNDSLYIEEGIRNLLMNQQQVVDFIDSHDFESNEEGIKRVLPYKKFEKDYNKDNSDSFYISPFESSYKIQVNNMSIGISSLNTAWRCYDSEQDKGNLIIGERQISRSLDFISDSKIKIALLHHSMDHLIEFDKRSSDQLITENYDIALFGHNHTPISWQMSSIYGAIFVSSASANWTYNLRSGQSAYYNNYSIIDYDPLEKSGIQKFRRYSHDTKKYIVNTEIRENGIFTFQLPKDETIDELTKLHELSSQIEDKFRILSNENLLTFYTDTTAPKEIDDIFVEPIIIKKKSFDTETPDDEEQINITDICETKDNLIIFGSKESGKTLLLDMIVLLLSRNINKCQKIPVYIDMETFTHSRFETAISLFLSIPIREIESFLSKKTTVLIIDNIAFNKTEKYRIDKLVQFINKYQIQVICTSLQTIENQIPLDFLEFELYNVFVITMLKPFKTIQIQELTNKWFKNIIINDSKERTDKIINLLLTLNLPRTPLAISMFLWIIEKQEDFQPINQATMLENFIEKLFKKHSREEMFFSSFDYKNKERLLSNIAFEMLNKGGENYCISYSHLIEYVETYLSHRKFSFCAIDLVNHFTEKGVLIYIHNGANKLIRFRFNCFFHYYLMKYMTINNEFLNFVLDEGHYLAFEEEIDYYTGLKRDEAKILTDFVNRMEQEYKGLIEEITNMPSKFDTFFISTTTTIADSLDRGFIDSMQENRKKIQSEIISIKDKMLDDIKPKYDIDKINFNISPFQKLEKIWTIAAKVLRNTEEIEVPNLKHTSIVKIANASIAFMCLYKVTAYDHLSKYPDRYSEEKKNDLHVMLRFLPIIHEAVLFDILGTIKLEIVFSDYINQIISKKSTSDIELFLAIFLYADLKVQDYLKYIKRFLKKIKHRFMYDILLFKVVSYYFLRSINKNMDLEYENLIADIILLSKDIPKTEKSKIMKRYKERKEKKIRDEQKQLDFDDKG